MNKDASRKYDIRKSDDVSEQNRPVIQNYSRNGESSMIPLRFTSQNLVEALIYSEILNEPKCKRRGRCR